MHHVAPQNFYADIGIALCDALYDVRRAAPYLALPKELLLPEIVHRRAVVDDRPGQSSRSLSAMCFAIE